MKKIVLAVLIVVSLLTAATVSSQSSWVGTDSMTVGSIIRSAPLKANLDYLFNFKVQKPGDCNQTNQRLAWDDGTWLCETYVPDDVVVGQSCSFAGATIQDGDSIAAFLTTSVPNGQSCASEVRTCSNGTLSGTYTNRTCQPQDPSACTFNSQTVQSGDDVIAYSASSVAFGETCERENRTCSDGTLSGSYAFSSCSVVAPGSCSISGDVVQHGQSVDTYEAASVTTPGVCRSQTRTCTDGSLSGSYESLSCEVLPATCSSQDLNFSYTVSALLLSRVYGASGIIDMQSETYNCTVPSSLVGDSDNGETLTFTEGQCNGGSSAVATATHTATCGYSGWELSTGVTADPLVCSDAGTVVERRSLAYTVVRVESDDRCECGVSLTGGQYGRDVVCAGTNNVENTLVE